MREISVTFGHVNGGQFLALHRYLTESGLVRSRLLCSKRFRTSLTERISGIQGVEIGAEAGEVAPPDKGRLAQAISGSFYREFQAAQENDRWPVYVGHAIFGCPVAMFGRTSGPIVSYFEYPSFRSHGWDPAYPPSAGDLAQDRKLEHLSLACAHASDHCIVPSAYAKAMFPAALQSKFTVQMDGFEGLPAAFEHSRSEGGKGAGPTVGFAARDLSTAKGFDRFVRIAKRLVEALPDVQFVVLGGTATPYGYEARFLQSSAGTASARTFAGYCMNVAGVDPSRFTFHGFLDSVSFDRIVKSVDVFLYPLRFGSANWGLFELMRRGRPIVASNRCYVEEVIRDGESGIVMPLEDEDGWLGATLRLLEDNALRERIGRAAVDAVRQFEISHVANAYLKIIEKVMGRPSRTAYVWRSGQDFDFLGQQRFEIGAK